MKVKIYTTPMCPWCQREKEFLKENNIAYAEADVSTDAKAAREMTEKSGQTGVPVTEIDGKIIVGFDKEALKKAIGLK